MGEPAHAPIGAHRLLGDGRATALIRPDAEIDWWCAPEMDDPPLAWSLLDTAGGVARWDGARMVTMDPSPAGPTAHTTIRASGQTIECWDGLVWQPDGGSVLVRLARCQDAALDVVHELVLGGFDQDWVRWDPTTGAAGQVGAHRVLVAGGTGAPAGGHEAASADGRPVLRRRVRAPRAEWAALTIAVDAPSPGHDGRTLAASLDAAEQGAGRRRGRTLLTRVHPERAADALAVLACCTYRPTGAVIASPTTSLPEAPGGDRQFDYRYSWLRDTSLAVSVAALLGRADLGERYLAEVTDVLADRPLPCAPVFTVRGDEVPPERTIDGVAGWLSSTPVRVGNDARLQTQLNALALLVEAVSVHVQMGGRLVERTWALIARTGDTIADDVLGNAGPVPENGIWEFRTAQAFVSADIGRWLALDRAIWIARGWRPWTRRRRWVRARGRVHARVVAALDDDGGLPQAYGQDPPRADAAALMAAVFHLFDAGDPRARRLVDTTIAALGAGPFLYRYEPGGDDGFRGREGAFLPVSWWAVAALAATGRGEQARARADAMCAVLPRLLAEEVEPATGAGLGNAPLLWSHIEAARALYLIDAARRRDRWGGAGMAAWRLGRFVRVKLRSARVAGRPPR